MRATQELISGDDLPVFEEDSLKESDVYSYSSLWQAYLDSDEGIYHAAQPLRFSAVYGYDPLQMQHDLGPNVHPVKHMEVVHRAGQHVLLAEMQGDRLTVDVRDIPLVRVVTGGHELGENTHPRYGRVVGDIPYGQKTIEQRLYEQQVRLKVFEQFWPQISLLTRANAIIMHMPESVRDEAVHKVFEAAHQISDYRTGIVSGIQAVRSLRDMEAKGIDIAQLSPQEQLRIMQLSNLSRDVVTSMHDVVGATAEQFIFVDTMFRRFEATRKLVAAERSFI